MTTLERLADCACRICDEDLPGQAIANAKVAVLDWLGVAMGGSRTPVVDKLLLVVQKSGGAPQVTVIGHGCHLSAIQAALVNGTMGHVLDYDDTHADFLLHATTAVLPAALAVAEKEHRLGKELLTAYITGYEIAVALARELFPSHYEMGWHATGTLGTIGAAAGAGKLLNLSISQMQHALGIAATQAAGFRAAFGSMCKSFHAGKASAQGLLAALLAREGFTSVPDIIEKGMMPAMSREGVDKILAGAGHTNGNYAIERNSIKPYACGLLIHPAIDAVLLLRQAYGLQPNDIQEIVARVHYLVPRVTGIAAPSTGLEAKFSLSHCLALALVKGGARESYFTDDVVSDPLILSLREKVRVEVNPAFRATEAQVTVRTCQGKELCQYVPHSKGTPENPMTSSELEEKFLDLAEPYLQQRAKKVIQMVSDLEQVEDVAHLISLLI